MEERCHHTFFGCRRPDAPAASVSAKHKTPMNRIATNLKTSGSRVTTTRPRLVALPWEGGIEEHQVVETHTLEGAVELPVEWPDCGEGHMPILELDFNAEDGFRRLRVRDQCLVLPETWEFCQTERPRTGPVRRRGLGVHAGEFCSQGLCLV